MCEPTTIAMSVAALTAYTQYSEGVATARAAKVEGTNQRNIMEYNAKVADVNAELQRRGVTDSLSRGATEAGKERLEGRRITAAGRAASASSGTLVDTGNVGDIIAQNAQQAELNAQTIANNAEREAYGYKIGALDQEYQAQNLRLQGQAAYDQAMYRAKSARRSGLLSAATTLVTAAATQGLFSGGNSLGQTVGRQFSSSSYGPYLNYGSRALSGYR